MFSLKWLATTIAAGALLCSAATEARALTIVGTVFDKKSLLTGSPVNTTAHALLKISFETTTEGNNLSLCAGSGTDFAAGVCRQQLNGSGGPGSTFLTIIDAAVLDGKILYVLQNAGDSPASFTVTIE